MFSRKLKNINEISSYTGHNCGDVLEWQYFLDWPGNDWTVSKGALRAWLKKHGIKINPEPAIELNRPKKQIKLPRRRW